jgi:hypothetical protein
MHGYRMGHGGLLRNKSSLGFPRMATGIKEPSRGEPQVTVAVYGCIEIGEGVGLDEFHALSMCAA